MSEAVPSVAVIGGGIIGLSVAWRLSQKGCSVTVFDQSSFGGEASWAGAGMLAPGGEVEEASGYAVALCRSRQIYGGYVRELEKESGAPVDYQECGGLDLAYSDEEWTAIQNRAQLQEQAGIPSKPVSLASVKAFWPRVEMQNLVGARFCPGDGIVDPRNLVASLKLACTHRGVALKDGSPVSSIQVGSSCVDVVDAQGRCQFTTAVVAAGAWSSSLHVEGIPPLPKARPVKGQLIGYHQPEATCATILRHRSTYLLQRANGLLIVGASVEEAGFDRTVNEETTASLAGQAASVLPHLGETTPSESWIGFRPQSDQLHVGRWHSQHLHLAYGHFRNGILLAPWTAEQLAQSILRHS